MSQPINPYDPPVQPSTGMSGTTKVLLTLGVGCGVFVLLCCGVFGIGGYFMGRAMQEGISKDPQKVRDATEEIVTIDVPESLPPAMTMDMKIPIVDKRLFLMVMYGEENEDNMLVIAEMSRDFGDEEKMEVQMKTSLQQNRRKDVEEVDVQTSEKIEHEINGKPATLRLSQGRGTKSGDNYWQVEGIFSGKEGPALLMIKLKDPPHDKEEVMRIINSMK